MDLNYYLSFFFQSFYNFSIGFLFSQRKSEKYDYYKKIKDEKKILIFSGKHNFNWIEEKMTSGFMVRIFSVPGLYIM